MHAGVGMVDGVALLAVTALRLLRPTSTAYEYGLRGAGWTLEIDYNEVGRIDSGE